MVHGDLALNDAGQVEGAPTDENSVFVRSRVADDRVGADSGGLDLHVDNASTYSSSATFIFEEDLHTSQLQFNTLQIEALRLVERPDGASTSEVLSKALVRAPAEFQVPTRAIQINKAQLLFLASIYISRFH